MGKSKLRKKLASLLGRRLYKGKRGKHVFGAGWLRTLIWKAEFAEGQLVSDCDGFNHVVTETIHVESVFRGVSLVRNIEHTKQRLGEVSWFCHIGPPRSRLEIETELKQWYTDPEWNPDNSELSPTIVKRRDALLCGKHITDEQGILLPEYEGDA